MRKTGGFFGIIVFLCAVFLPAWAAFAEDQCAYGFSPTSKIFDASGGVSSVTVTPSSGTCPWTATSNALWITITTGGGGTGYGIFGYSVAANATPDSRSGTLTIGDRTFIVSQAGAASQYPLDNWFFRTAGGGAVYFSASYGKNRYVAAGQGALLTSPDGQSWEPATLPNGVYDNFTGVAFGNDMFVAVGFLNSTIMSSTDGLLWTLKSSAPTSGLNNVVFCDGKFVKLGSSGSISTSIDGQTWTEITFSSNHLYGAACGNGKIVAVGNYFLGGGIISSSDGGSTWTDVSPQLVNALRGVAFGNGLFVAVGQWGTILTSTDGITWTLRPVGIEERHLMGVVFSHGVFVAVGDKGTIITSLDGIHWSYRTSGLTNDLRGVTFGDKTFVAVGDSAVTQSDPLYSISGSVSDSDSRLGIKGAAVTVKDGGGNPGTPATTDASGNYVLALLFPGDYTVEAGKPGYTMQSPPPLAVTLDDGHRAATLDTMYLSQTTISSVPLNPGWNFISVPRQHPVSSGIEVALSDVSGNIRVIWSYDNEGKEWKKWRRGGSGNTLMAIEPNRGYWMYADAAIAIDMAEWLPQESTSIRVYEGWNLVGYLGANDTNATTALNNISGKWSTIWSWDNEQWKGKDVVIETFPPPLMPLSVFTQGKACWVKIKKGAGPIDWVQ